MSISELFGVTGAITTSQECARAVLVFVYGLALVRLAGRRIFGKWSALDIVVSIVVGSNLSRTITANAPLWSTLVATTAIIVLHWLLAHGAARWRAASRLTEGHAIQLGKDGALDSRSIRLAAVSEADLNEALRAAGIQDWASARLIMLEPSGRISVLK